MKSKRATRKRKPRRNPERLQELKSREKRADEQVNRFLAPDKCPGSFGPDIGQRETQPEWLRKFILAGRERLADKIIEERYQQLSRGPNKKNREKADDKFTAAQDFNRRYPNLTTDAATGRAAKEFGIAKSTAYKYKALREK